MKKILFCHIPKCSGMNLNDLLIKYKNIQNKQKNNITYVWYIHKILQYDLNIYNDYYKFAIIREPIQKIVSLYFYQISNINYLKQLNKLQTYQPENFNKISILYEKYNITDIYSFLNKYKKFYYTEIEPYISKLKIITSTTEMSVFYVAGYLPQYLYICDNNKKILVDDVIDIKNQNDFLYKKFGIINNTKKNSHKHSDENYLNYLSPQNIEDIKIIYNIDYELFYNNKKS